MMFKTFSLLRSNIPAFRRSFASSEALASQHKTVHSSNSVEPRFYEKDFVPTSAKEIEFVRSPFYDLVKGENMKPEQAQELLETVALKIDMTKITSGILDDLNPTKEEKSYTRYADTRIDEDVKHIFQFPKGEPYRQIPATDLFRIQKPPNHLEMLRRSKSFLAETFFGPFELRETNLRELFRDKSVYANTETKEFEEWKLKLLEVIPKLNYDIIVQLALHLSIDAKLNDRHIWQAIEE